MVLFGHSSIQNERKKKRIFRNDEDKKDGNENSLV